VVSGDHPIEYGGIPPAEVDIDEQLVRGLLRSQHPDLAGFPLRHVATGWDNVTYRLGSQLAVRLPRFSGAAPLIILEQTWLPRLADHLPVAIPVPLRQDRPGDGFPWPAACPGRSSVRTTRRSTRASSSSGSRFSSWRW
jgi:aminoglycoside phosphotransferase (APT) family kinase protein